MRPCSFRCGLWTLLVVNILIIFSVNAALATSFPQLTLEDRISTIQRIHQRGDLLLVGVSNDFPPFGFENEEGELVGFEIDLMRAMVKTWGIKVEFVKLTPDTRIPLLAAGEIDIVAATLPHTQEQANEIDFSQTYYVGGQALLLCKNSGINTLPYLQGRRVAAIQGTTSLQMIVTYSDLQRLDIEVVPFAEFLPALDALASGTVDALTSDPSALAWFAKNNPCSQILMLPVRQVPYAFGIQTNDAYFRHLVNSTLQQLKVDGTYDKIYKEWFPLDSLYPLEVLPGKWKHHFADTPAAFSIPGDSVVDKIERQHTFGVGVKIDSPPFAFADENGVCCQGFEIDLVGEFAKRWIGDERAILYRTITSTKEITASSGSQWDIFVGALIPTWQLEESIDFSQPYFDYAANIRLQNNPALSATIVLSTPLRIGLPDNDSKFQNLVNFTLQAMTIDGSYQRIYQKWFSTSQPYPIEIWPGIPRDPFIADMVKDHSIANIDYATISFTASHLRIVPYPTPGISISSPKLFGRSETDFEVNIPNLYTPPSYLPQTGSTNSPYKSILIMILVTVFLVIISIVGNNGQDKREDIERF